MSNNTIYIEHNYPSFGYAIGLFTLQCVVVLSLLFCCCCCCFKSQLKNGNRKEFQNNTVNFEITKYSEFRKADRDYFKTHIKQNNKKDSKDETKDGTKDGTNNGVNDETKDGTKDGTNNETGSGLLTNLCVGSENKSENDNKQKNNDEKKVKDDINNKSNVFLRMTKLFCNLIKMIIRIISCGKLFVNKEENEKEDIENKKKKYLLFKFNNFNLDELDESFTRLNPYKGLKDFVEIIDKVYNPYDFEILLHISSPGGVAFKFEELHCHLKKLTKKGFIITALVDDICASGGYMLASACNKIIASPYAKIGSVGVICTAVNYHELSQKLGLTQKTFKTGKYKGSFPTGEKITKEDEDRMDELIKETLKIFAEMVKQGRNLSDEEMEIILSAKVWCGEEALEKKLIDTIELPSDYLNNLLSNSEIYIVNQKQTNKSLPRFTKIFSMYENICENAMEIMNTFKINEFDYLKIKLN